MGFVTVKSAEGPDTPYQVSQELLDARPDDFIVVEDEQAPKKATKSK